MYNYYVIVYKGQN